MSKDVTKISDFRFNSLRKFMRPVYAELDRHRSDPADEKRTRLKTVIRDFFWRLRTYREITVDTLAEAGNITSREIEMFESGAMAANSAIEHAYCRVCFGYHERDFFERRIYEFLNPTVRASKEAIAEDALKRFGIVMPDIDYATLKSPKGVLLEFTSRR